MLSALLDSVFIFFSLFCHAISCQFYFLPTVSLTLDFEFEMHDIPEILRFPAVCSTFFITDELLIIDNMLLEMMSTFNCAQYS